MDLTPETQQRLDAITANQHTYQPSVGVQRVIKDKTLIMIVAPAAMGKSHLISHAVQSDPRFAQTTSFTTRDPRSGDEGNMRTVPRDNAHIGLLLDLIESGQVVNYTLFPTTGMLYGTDLGSYPGEINLMATLANSVDALRRTGFGSCVTVGLVAPPDTWQSWFTARFPAPSSEKTARLKEALLSIDWLLQEPDVRWVVNRDGEIDTVTSDLIALANDAPLEPDVQALAYAQQLRALIIHMLE